MHRIAVSLVAFTLVVASLATGALAQQKAPDFASADANKDGQVSYSELVIVVPTATQDQFNTADMDKSGGLSQTEFGGMSATMAPAAK
ncbi:MAG TPA: EF-hand domain-containing protein [Devosiaceae bacterium]|jgi:hypothetical protein|nr:EF-hand domain-containing protein [Devosiaceae bacterium]